jgi:hypothetical protein
VKERRRLVNRRACMMNRIIVWYHYNRYREKTGIGRTGRKYFGFAHGLHAGRLLFLFFLFSHFFHQLALTVAVHFRKGLVYTVPRIGRPVEIITGIAKTLVKGLPGQGQ